MTVEFEEIENKINKIKKIYNRNSGDIKPILNILEASSRNEINEIKRYLSTNSPQLYVAINENIILFEDLIQLDQKGVRLVYSEIGPQTIGLAMRLADEGIRRNFLAYGNKEEKEEVIQIMEGAPRKKIEVETAMNRILGFIRTLESQGKIKIVGGLVEDNDVYV